jgi:hypothetical protein
MSGSGRELLRFFWKKKKDFGNPWKKEIRSWLILLSIGHSWSGSDIFRLKIDFNAGRGNTVNGTAIANRLITYPLGVKSHFDALGSSSHESSTCHSTNPPMPAPSNVNRGIVIR